MSKYVVVITGASSGFGALTARAISRAGHTVYAGMRWTAGENAKEVEAVRQFALDEKVDLRSVEMDVQAIAKVVDTPFGKRPFRITIDPADAGAEVINMMGDRVRTELFRRIGMEDLLKPYGTA